MSSSKLDVEELERIARGPFHSLPDYDAYDEAFRPETVLQLLAERKALVEALRDARAELEEHHINLVEAKLRTTASDVSILNARIDSILALAGGQS